MIEKLRLINKDIIDTTLDSNVKDRHLIINEIMEDDNCFFKMNIEYAYAILRDLGIPEEELEYIYFKLIDPKERND
ncbi:MAG: hypothetical protein OSJ65_08210 [Bacilli bacterium]|nr:hypothetical protein [Bacilli bacterium]